MLDDAIEPTPLEDFGLAALRWEDSAELVMAGVSHGNIVVGVSEKVMRVACGADAHSDINVYAAHAKQYYTFIGH